MGNYDVIAAILEFFQNPKQHKITQDHHMYLHIKFSQDPTIFDKVRILEGNMF